MKNTRQHAEFSRIQAGYLRIMIVTIVAVLALPAAAETAITAEEVQRNLDFLWVIAAAALVFLMQGGFLCIESGMATAKNSINVAIKNLADFVLAVAGFWVVGFGLMFGDSVSGWIGGSGFFLTVEDPWLAAFFIFQAVFVGTAATIDSGAIAGRARFSTYLILSLLVSTFIYPISGHWVWGSLFNGSQAGWLESLGFLDFAGSTVVHSVGGWVALAGVIVIGPRLDRFDESGKPNRIPPHNMTFAYLGGLILFFGWFGFNGGSTLAASADIAPIILNTVLAACFGCISCSILSWLYSPMKRPEGEMIVNGMLGGLVAITAGCAFVDTTGAIVIGLIGGIVCYLGSEFNLRVLKVDDVVGAIPVHGYCGAWGTVALAMFITEEALDGGSRLGLIGVQLLGVIAVFVWAFGTAYLLMKGIDRISPLRVSPEDEKIGLNVAEHGATSGLFDLVVAMHQATNNRRFDDSIKVAVETGTEIGDLAQGFNQMIDAVQASIADTEKALGRLEEQRINADSERLSYFEATEEQLKILIERSRTVSNQAGVSAREAEDVATTVTTASSGMTALTDALDAVSSQAQDAARSSNLATQRAERSREAITLLKSSASEIGRISQVIEGVAKSTRLLAVNASIEAAHAGAAGKGFGVVAEEVGDLSQQTSESLRGITEQVNTMQSRVEEAVASITAIADELGALDEFSQSVAAIVDQERRRSQELQSAVSSAADRALANSDVMKGMVETAQSISRQVSNTHDEIRNIFGVGTQTARLGI